MGKARYWSVEGLSVELLPARPYASDDPTHLATLGVCFDRQKGVHAIAGDRRRDFDRLPGSISIVPKALPLMSESEAGGEFLAVRFSADACPSPNDRVVGHLGPRHMLALGYAENLRRLLLATEEACPLQVEEGVLALLHSAAHSGMREPRVDQSLLRDVIDSLDAHALEQGVRVSDVARRFDLSTVELLRLFKRATGVTPGRYVLDRRISAVRRMLASDMSLAGIAAECGFAHQSHMGLALKRRLGVTPARLRALLRES